MIEGAGDGDGDVGDMLLIAWDMDEGEETGFERGDADCEEVESSAVEGLEGGAERFDFGWDLEREAFCAASVLAWRIARVREFDVDVEVEVDVEVDDNGGWRGGVAVDEEA